NFVLQFCPTNPAEREVRARFAKLGIDAEGDFDAASLSAETRQAIMEGIADAWEEFAQYKKAELDTGKRTSADAFGTRAHMAGRYIDRMAGTVLGIYGNSKEEALYPAYFADSAGEL